VPRAEANLLGDPAPLTALPILGPFFGQVELEVDQGMLRIRDIAEVDADLTVIAFA
jgi:hypothetical protein